MAIRQSILNVCLLPSYVLVETAKAVLCFAIIQLDSGVSPTFVVLCAYMCQIIFTIPFILWNIYRKETSLKPNVILQALKLHTYDSDLTASWKSYCKIIAPALFCGIVQILYLIALNVSSPVFLHAMLIAQLPMTATLRHVILQSQRDVRAWLSLGVLCIGLLIANLPLDLDEWLVRKGINTQDATTTSVLGVGFGLIIAIISSVARIYDEKFSTEKIPFWIGQFWLYIFGAGFSAIVTVLWNGSIKNSMAIDIGSTHLSFLSDALHTPISTLATIVAITSLHGLCTAKIAHKKDSAVNVLGISCTIAMIFATQISLFPTLRETIWTVYTVVGIGLIALSAWCYQFYSSRNPVEEAAEYTALPMTASTEADDKDTLEPGSESQRTQEENDGTLEPTIVRIGLVSVLVSILAIFTYYYGPHALGTQESDAPKPDINTSLLYARPEGIDDLARFFDPNNITAANWETIQSHHTCISDWVQRDKILPNSPKFTEWEYTFINSSCPVYPVPQGGLLYHQYWNGKWRPFNDVSIEAFLATQRLADGHRLIYWYEGEGPSRETRDRFTQGDYARYVEFREFDREEEGKGFCVDSMLEWSSESYRKSLDMPMVALSDLTRNLLLTKYGGIWLDSDTIPLRDFTPLIRSGPSAQGLEEKFWNNNLLIFGPPMTNVSRAVLDTTCKLSYNHTRYIESQGENPIEPFQWSWLWNDGLFRNCAEKGQCGIGRVPVIFNDGFCWTWEGQQEMKPCDNEDARYASGHEILPTMRTLWTWHTRLSQFDDACVDPKRNTIAGSLRRRINHLLARGLDMNGRDLYPGPAFVD